MPNNCINKNCKLITNKGDEKLNKEKCLKKRLSNSVWYLKIIFISSKHKIYSKAGKNWHAPMIVFNKTDKIIVAK